LLFGELSTITISINMWTTRQTADRVNFGACLQICFIDNHAVNNTNSQREYFFSLLPASSRHLSKQGLCETNESPSAYHYSGP